MKVIIAGSRHMLEDYDLLEAGINATSWHFSEVVCGLALGADTWGKKWAEHRGIPVAEFPADWKKYGRAAGPIRNKQMAEYANAAIVFIWDNSRGSANMIKQMKELNKPVFVVQNGQL